MEILLLSGEKSEKGGNCPFQIEKKNLLQAWKTELSLSGPETHLNLIAIPALRAISTNNDGNWRTRLIAELFM